MIRRIELSQHHHREFTQDKLRRHTSVHSISSEDDVDDVEENDPTGVPPTSELRRRKSTSYDVSNVDYLKAREEDPLAEFYAQARAGHETVRRLLYENELYGLTS